MGRGGGRRQQQQPPDVLPFPPLLEVSQILAAAHAALAAPSIAKRVETLVPSAALSWQTLLLRMQAAYPAAAAAGIYCLPAAELRAWCGGEPFIQGISLVFIGGVVPLPLGIALPERVSARVEASLGISLDAFVDINTLGGPPPSSRRRGQLETFGATADPFDKEATRQQQQQQQQQQVQQVQ
ncbi:hypothetical protein Emag_004563 [Eimeria magna]